MFMLDAAAVSAWARTKFNYVPFSNYVTFNLKCLVYDVVLNMVMKKQTLRSMCTFVGVFFSVIGIIG